MDTKKPQAYRDGRTDFYGRDFRLTSDVLIPRPETELLIDGVLALAGKPYLAGLKVRPSVLSKRPLICDVGTGSGCIAVTLALEIPEAEVHGIDISGMALKVARQNAQQLGAKVMWHRSDLLTKMPKTIVEDTEVFVANLPYVDVAWEWLDKEALAYEPEIALYATDGGLALIKRLIQQITEVKRQRSALLNSATINTETYLILEADPCQHERIIKYAATWGWRHDLTSGFGLRLSF